MTAYKSVDAHASAVVYGKSYVYDDDHHCSGTSYQRRGERRRWSDFCPVIVCDPDTFNSRGQRSPRLFCFPADLPGGVAWLCRQAGFRRRPASRQMVMINSNSKSKRHLCWLVFGSSTYYLYAFVASILAA
jgi:hypothetical protein